MTTRPRPASSCTRSGAPWRGAWRRPTRLWPRSWPASKTRGREPPTRTSSATGWRATGASRRLLLQLLHGPDEVAHALAADEAGVLVEKRVQAPPALVGGAREVLVAHDHGDAPAEVPRFEEGDQGVQVVPVAAKLTVRRQEV